MSIGTGPNPGGNLVVGAIACDACRSANIVKLPSPGMELRVSYAYNSGMKSCSEYGYGRTISTNLQLSVSRSSVGRIIHLLRGNGVSARFQETRSGSFKGSRSNRHSLILDQYAGLWIETTRTGEKTAYPALPDGEVSKVCYVEDAVGNRHKYDYNANGLLQSVTDAVGRQVVLSFNEHKLLETVRDWAGRITRFAYDMVVIAQGPVLTEVTGPTGCITRYAYSKDGLLNSIIDPNGYRTQYTYDDHDRVIGRTISGGGTTTYEYTSQADANQYTRTTIDALGQKTIEVFGQNNRLISSVFPSGRTTSTLNPDGRTIIYHSNGLAVATQMQDEHGNTISETSGIGRKADHTYDVYGNLTSTTTQDGLVTQQLWGFKGSSFDETGEKRRLQVLIAPNGNNTIFTYNEMGQRLTMTSPTGSTTRYAYDTFGNMSTMTDGRGGVRSFKHDAAGNVIEATSPTGAITRWEFDARDRVIGNIDALGNETKYAYDGNGNKIVQIDALGNRWAWTYDVWDNVASTTTPLGHKTVNKYDCLGRNIAKIDPLGNRMSRDLNPDGRLTSTTDALGYKTTYEYDSDGRRVLAIDPLGNRTLTKYDGVLQTTLIDPLENKTTSIYNEYGRHIRTIDPIGYSRSTEYDGHGAAVYVTDALGFRSQYIYDEFGRNVGTIDQIGGRSSVVYDPHGLRLATIDALGNKTAFEYNLVGQMTASIGPMGDVTSFNYDGAGRLASIIDPVGSKTSMIYDKLGRRIATINPLGHKAGTRYDADGRIVSETDSLGHVTTFRHDGAGRRVSVTDANGKTTRTVYDANGRIAATIDQLGACTKFEYDGTGNMVKRVDPHGIETQYKYNALRRRTGVFYSGGTSVVYTYDQKSRKASVQDSNGVAYYTYDAKDHLTSVTDHSGRTVSYSYDAAGRQTSLTDCSGGKTTYDYDLAGRLLLIRNPVGEETKIGYDKLGRISQKCLANGLVIESVYDGASRKTLERQRNAAGTLLAEVSAKYDEIGNPVLVREYDGSEIGYAYDGAGQIIGEKRSGLNPLDVKYSYDPAGNRVSKIEDGEATEYEYNDTNALTRIDRLGKGRATTLMYDAAGNLKTEETDGATSSYEWDGENRLVSINFPGYGELKNFYNADGQRIKIVTPNKTRSNVYDGKNLLHEFGDDGNMLATYTAAPGIWGSLVSRRLDHESTFYSFDFKQNVNNLTNGEGVVVAAYTYGAFGEPLSGTPGGVNPFRFGGAVGYEGGEYNDLVYVRARWYDPAAGRWISKDPSGYGGGDWNLYRYVKNQPTTTVDPTGLAGLRCKAPKGGTTPPGWFCANHTVKDCCDCCENATSGDCYPALSKGTGCSSVKTCFTPPDSNGPCGYQSPCLDIITGLSVDVPTALLNCLKGAATGGDKEGDAGSACVTEYKGTIADAVTDAIAEYLGCMYGSTIQGGGCLGSNPCEPPGDMYCGGCCYQKFMTEMLKCYMKPAYAGNCMISVQTDFTNCQEDCTNSG